MCWYVSCPTLYQHMPYSEVVSYDRCPGSLFSDPAAGGQFKLRTVSKMEQQKALCKRSKAPAKKLKEHSCKHSIDLSLLGCAHSSLLLVVHPETSGFRGCWFGSSKHGIHLAAGPDWMHLILEGLGKHLLTYMCGVLQQSGISLSVSECVRVSECV